MAGGPGRAVVLTNTEYHLPAPGATFAGRDVFAPVAAHLCNGVALEDLGELIEPDVLLPGIVPIAREEGGGLVGEILWVDRFGNAQINVGPEDVDGWGERIRLRFGTDVRVGQLAPTFAEIAEGTVGLVIDSYGLLAVALDRASAADELRLAAGDRIVLERFEADEPPTVTAAVAFPTRR
jgi:S-adenosylmethionine hydrolase